MPPAKKTPGPSVLDPETYEALREEGASKEKAARIANASATRGRSAVKARRAAGPARTTTGPSRTFASGPVSWASPAVPANARRS